MATNKNNISIAISPTAKSCLDQLNSWSGMDRKLILDNVLKWLVEVPDEFKSGVLMNVPPSLRADFLELLIKRLQDDLKRELDQEHKTTAGQIRPTHSAGSSRSPAAAKSGHPHSAKKT